MKLDSLQTVCAHCGEHIRKVSHHSDHDDQLVFCCAGCKGVYELLQAHNMCDYYAMAPSAGTRQANSAQVANDLEVLADPLIAAQFTEWTIGRTSRLHFVVPSIHCSSCVWLLDQLHRFDSGILCSTVDFMNKTVRVDIIATQTTITDVASLLSSLGYTPLLTSDAQKKSGTIRRSVIRGLYLRLGIAGFAFGNIMMFAIATYAAGGLSGLPSELRILFPLASLLLTVPVLLYSAQPWFSSAFVGLRSVFFHGKGLKAWNLDIPVALGMLALVIRSIADIISGSGEGFLDSFTGLVFFLLIGRLVLEKTYDAISFDRTYRSFFPLSSRREQKTDVEVVPIENIVSGDVLRIRNAEVVPTDCILLDEVAYVDYSFVTGESRPIECRQGQRLLAGGKNIGREIRMSAIEDVDHQRLAGLWERSKRDQRDVVYGAKSNQFGLAFTIGTIGVALTGLWLWLPDVSMALRVFASVLIIACPCALTIAAPVTYGRAMGLLGRRGIYLRSPQTVSELLDIDVVAFDKTGTLTTVHGDLDVSKMQATEDQWMRIAALAEQSTHPMSKAIVEYVASRDFHEVGAVEEFPGMGIRGMVDGVPVIIGKSTFVVNGTEHHEGTHISVDGLYVGSLHLRPRLRDASLLTKLTQEVVLISGDSDRDAPLFAQRFGDNMFFNQSPAEKVECIQDKQKGNRRVLMVGDGLNDASALNAADVSIAVTDNSSTLAPASDVVMKAHNVNNIAAVLAYAASMRRVVAISLVVTMAYNALGFTLALSGILSPVLTAILMPLSNLLVIAISLIGAHYYDRRTAWV